jgi:hypothetical protein
MPRGPASVPCGGCTLCCRSGELIVVTKGDAPPPEGWRFMVGGDATAAAAAAAAAALGVDGVVGALAQREDGACVYMTEDGCAIHPWAPMVCKAFTCAGLYEQTPRAQRRAFASGSAYHKALYAQGRRMHTLISGRTP